MVQSASSSIKFCLAAGGNHFQQRKGRGERGGEDDKDKCAPFYDDSSMSCPELYC